MGTRWRIELLGGLRAIHGERELTRFRTQKTGVLLAYLAYYPQRPHPRDYLIELLWPEADLQAGSNSLSQALSFLRRQLEPPGIPAGTVLAVSRAAVRLNPSAIITDVAEFEAALHAAAAAQTDAERVEWLARAVESYHGELLAGYYERWVLEQREWLAESYFQTLHQLLALLVQRDELTRALEYARRGVQADPLREEARQDLMRLYAAAGQPEAALRQYRELERLLQQQLGATPHAATRALATDIEQRQLSALGSPLSAEANPSSQMGPVALTVTASQARGAESEGPGKQVLLLSPTHLQPDGHLLEALERRLIARGYRVFVDRPLTKPGEAWSGVEWARELERQVHAADAVVPLLSSASVQSEMLAYEVQMAREVAQQPRGTPRLLPVRVRYVGPLPEPLASILEPIESSLWEGPQDDERLVEALVHAIENAEPSRGRHVLLDHVVARASQAPLLGAVPLDSPFYVVRPTDGAFHSAIARGDSIVLVKGARQMGKTSLLARGLQQAREAGARVIRMDLQMLDGADLASSESFFRALAVWIADQLDLDVIPDQLWKPHLGPSVNFVRYLRREVLGQIVAPIVWGLDEVDQLFSYDFGSRVFGLFRSWHNERALDPTGPWGRLTLAMAYATEAHLFITDMNQSPFNVGTRLTLEDFTEEQVADLNRRYGSPLRSVEEVARYIRLVGGHPYLVQRGLQEMATHDISIEALEAQADRDEGVFGDHLRRLLVSLLRAPELCDGVREVLQGRVCPTEEIFYRLRSAGVIAGESARDVRPRCQLYATYLERHLR